MMINWIIKGLTFFLVYWQIFGSETVTSAECNVTVVLLLLAHCLFLPPVMCVGGRGREYVWSLVCCALLSVVSSFTSISLGCFTLIA